MAEATWFYARENEEHGPVTAAQLKALVKKGEIDSTDLVWKEGMPNWSPVEDVRGMFDESGASTSVVFRPADSADSEETEDSPSDAPANNKTNLINLAPYGRWAGYAIVLLSLMAMMTMRGCSSIAASNEARIEQQLVYERSKIELSIKEKLAQLTDELQKAETSSTVSQSRIDELRQEVDSFKSRATKQWEEFENGELARLSANVASAAATRATVGFYSQMGFLIASLALLPGLFALAIFGQPPERWLSLIMAAVVLLGLVLIGNT